MGIEYKVYGPGEEVPVPQKPKHWRDHVRVVTRIEEEERPPKGIFECKDCGFVFLLKRTDHTQCPVCKQIDPEHPPELRPVVAVGAISSGSVIAQVFGPNGLPETPEILIDNGVTQQGNFEVLNSTFRSDQVAADFSWFMGLISNTSFTAVAYLNNAQDIRLIGGTPAGANAWLEFGGSAGNGYNGTNVRPSWPTNAPVNDSGQIDKILGTVVNFQFNVTHEVRGAFLNTTATQATTGAGNAAGETLYATATFAGPLNISSGSTLAITWTVRQTAV